MIWLEAHGFFDSDHGMRFERSLVFFADDRAEKVARIAQMECRLFIDDLPEVFDDPGFPSASTRCLFDPDNSHPNWTGAKRCRSWAEISQWMPRF